MIIKDRNSLNTLFIVVVLLLTLLAGVVGYWSWFNIKNKRVKDLSYSNSVIKRYYELSFNQWGNVLLNLGERLLNVKGASQDSIRLAIAKQSDENYDELLAFGLVDTTGQIIVFSNSQLGDSLPDLSKSENSSRSFDLAKHVDKISIGEAYYFQNVDDWILPVRVPIRDNNGNLVALNTTALQYSSLNRDLSSFGFDSRYKVHLINKDFGTSQLYYPMSDSVFSQLLKKSADIYADSEALLSDEVTYYQGVNTFENSQSIWVASELEGLNHRLIVSVDYNVLLADFRDTVVVVLCMYLLLLLLLFVLFSISEKRQAIYVSTLLEREANLKAIIESTSSVIGLFDTNKRLVEYNKAFAIYAKATDDINLQKGMDVLSKLKPEFGEIFRGFQDRALKGEKFRENLEYPGPEGTLHFLFSYNPIFKNGEIIGLSMFVEDITTLKQSQLKLEEYANNLEQMVQKRTDEIETKNDLLNARNKELSDTLSRLEETQKQLYQADKMASLGVLAAGVGHEINNPLNFIKNGCNALYQELSTMEGFDEQAAKPYFNIINNGVDRTSKIVKSLSHFSRQHKSMDELCEIHSILDNCLVILDSKIKSRILVQKQYSTDNLTLVGNEGKLHQACLNIIANAVQSIADTGTITLKTEKQNSQLLISIIDTGCGIATEHLNKINDPFFTTKEPGQGTGLGLFITYSIIQEHNGNIAVNSTLGKGSEFIICLPSL